VKSGKEAGSLSFSHKENLQIKDLSYRVLNELFSSVALRLTDSQPLKGRAESILGLIKEFFNIKAIFLCVLWRSSQTLYVSYSAGVDTSKIAKFVLSQENELLKRMKNFENIYLSDYLEMPEVKFLTEKLETSEGMFVPILLPDRNFYGAICACGKTFLNNEEFAKILKVIGTLLALAIDKKQKEKSLKLISEVSRLLVKERDLDYVLNEIVNVVRKLLKVDRVSLLLLEDNHLKIRASIGIPKDIAEKVSIKIGEGIAGHVAKTKEPLLVKDIEKDERFKNYRSGGKYSSNSLLSVPVLVQGELLGVLNVNNKVSGYIFNEDDMRILCVLADYAAIAIHNSRLISEILKHEKELEESNKQLKEKNEELEQAYVELSNAYEDIYLHLQLAKELPEFITNKKKLVEKIIECIVKCFERIEVLKVAVFLKNEEGIELVGLRGLSRRKVEVRTSLLKPHTVLYWVMSSGNGLMNSDIDIIKNHNIEFELADIVKNFLAVPLVVEEEKYGVIMVFSDEEEFTEKDRNTLQSIAQHAAPSIKSAELHLIYLAKKQQDRELEVAHNIQQKLMPTKFPDVSGLDIAGYSKPAKELGGDLFDVFEIEGVKDKIGITIADVSGKGVQAALFMTMTRSIVRANVGKSPRELLISLNKALRPDTERTEETGVSLYVTMVYAICDVKDFKIILSKAGHNPPILYRADKNDCELIEVKGLFAGIFDNEVFQNVIEDKEVMLNPGDKIIFYTDGLVEAMNSNNEEFDVQRVMNIIKANPYMDSASLMSKLFEEVEIHAKGLKQHDDITIVVIDRFLPYKMNMEFKYESRPEFGGKKSRINEVLTTIMKRIDALPAMSEEISYELQTVLDELVSNAVFHGNKEDPNKKVYINFEATDEMIKIEIEDEGEGFDVKKIMEDSPQTEEEFLASMFNFNESIEEDKCFFIESFDTDSDLLKEYGRGIFITKRLVDKLYYNEKGNKVTIIKKYR